MNEAAQNVQEVKQRKPILLIAGDMSGRVSRELLRQALDVVVVTVDGRLVAQQAGTDELREIPEVDAREALAVTLANVVDLAPRQDKLPPHDWYRRFAGRYGGRPPYF